MSYFPEAGAVSAAIIGTGAVGGYHIKAQTELGSNVVIYDSCAETAQKATATHDVAVARCFEEAVEAADVVHICTPPMDHRDSALAAIALGKPVIIEKPLTHNLAEAVDVYRAAQSSNVPVLVGKHFRLTPPFLEINDGLRGGEIGSVASIETDYVHDMGRLTVGTGWRKQLGSHGFMYEGAAHPVDLNMWLAAQPVAEVQAMVSGRKLRPDYGWAEDLTLAVRYQDGLVGRVWSNAAAPTPQHGTAVKVYGSEGAYNAHNKRACLNTYRDGDADWTTTPTAPIGQTIRPMAALFHEYLRGERASLDPMPDIEAALGVMIVLDTLEVAAESGRTERVPSLEEVLSGAGR